MSWADKLACLKSPPVIRNVNVLPSVISMKPFAAVILTPSPGILSGVKQSNSRPLPPRLLRRLRSSQRQFPVILSAAKNLARG